MKLEQTFISWLLSGVLIIMVLLAYTPAMQGGFIWDDDVFVTNNSLLKNLNGLRRIWVEPDVLPQYYPLVFTSLWVEYHLWGLHPFGYHAVNVLLHAVNAILLWQVLQRLRVPGAWIAAAIFALHPVHVESVAWIAERKNVLSGVFYLSALLVYLHFYLGSDNFLNTSSSLRQNSPRNIRRQHVGYYLLLVGLFSCALLSKTVTCSLSAAIFLLLWWKRDRITWHNVRALLPLFLIGALFAMVTIWLEKYHAGAQGESWDLSFVDRCLIAGRALWFYTGKLVWPYPIIFNYPRWQIDSGIWWQYFYPLTVVAVVLVLWFVRKRIGKAPLVAVLYFIGTLVPALGFFNVYPMQYSFVADHFQYLASIGLIALGVAGVSVMIGRTGVRSRHIQYGICAVILIILTVRTWNEGYKYQDREMLWRDTIAKNPDSFMAHYNLGVILAGQGNLEEAITHYSESLRVKPSAWTHTNLGLALAMQGKLEEAIHHYLQALRIGPHYAYTYNNLGIALMRQGNLKEAVHHFSEALEIDPHYTEAHNNLGVVLAMQGNLKEAIRHYLEALWLDPHYAKAHNNLESTLTNSENFNEAVDLVGAYATKEDAKALFLYKTIGELRPDFADIIYYNIARMYAQQNNVEKSVHWLKEAIERGFHDWDLLKSDKVFENIHNSSFYQELLERS